jgi:hypothetical protein
MCLIYDDGMMNVSKVRPLDVLKIRIIIQFYGKILMMIA